MEIFTEKKSRASKVINVWFCKETSCKNLEIGAVNNVARTTQMPKNKRNVFPGETIKINL